jgi:hypothetical protein
MSSRLRKAKIQCKILLTIKTTVAKPPLEYAQSTLAVPVGFNLSVTEAGARDTRATFDML